MKYVILIVSLFYSHLGVSQSIEITEIKRIMSLGEKTGYKLIIPRQMASTVEKITKDYLKSKNAEIVKSNKSKSEMIFRKLYINGVEQPLMLVATIEQEGSQVGWTGYFFYEKDTSSLDRKDTILHFVNVIYSKTIFLSYEDSIDIQASKLKEVASELKSKEKEVKKLQKNIDDAKDEINDYQKSIAKSEEEMDKYKSKKEQLTKELAEKSVQLKFAEQEMKKVEVLDEELDMLKSKEKKLGKNLSELRKNERANEYVITSQSADLDLLRKMIDQRQLDRDLRYEQAKSNLKTAKKNYNQVEDNVRDAEKVFEKNKENIVDSKKMIIKKRKEIDENQETMNYLNNKEIPNLEKRVQYETYVLDDIRKTQSRYKVD